MPGGDDLRRILARIDGRGYKAYRDIRGAFDFGALAVHVDAVQGDPFAAPSKLRVRVPMSEAHLPAALFGTPVRRVAFADHLTRCVARAIREKSSGRRGSGTSGLLSVDAGGQEVLERTAVRLDPDFVEVRVEAGLPAAGRRVLGREAEAMLCHDLPEIACRSLVWSALQPDDAHRFVELIENQEHIRDQLTDLGLVAFVGDGSVLPRESGASDRPLARAAAVPFESPESLRVRVRLANPIEGPEGRRGEITGMGLREGVTLIAGGGYHGKSTLLHALERAVYPHVPGDGREWVVSRRDLVKIRAEDGRRVERVDISCFIRDLPQGRSTAAFASDDASGSTSQASNIVEALEVGARGLLLDEDTSATNFLLRDARMQELVSRKDEPITPFLDRVRELYDSLGVSTVLVMGGCGDYFDAADCVIRMRAFHPEDATREARAIAAEMPTGRRVETAPALRGVTQRIPLPGSFDASRGRREVKIDSRGLDRIRFGKDDIDLRAVEQLVDPSQTRAVGLAIELAARRFMDGETTLRDVIDRLEELFDRKGLDVLDPHHPPGRHPGNFARPRRFEIAAAINRLRSLRVTQRQNLG